MTSEDLIAKAKEKKSYTIQDMIVGAKEELGKALPDSMSPERLTRIALTCLRTNPELTQCTPESLLGALFTSAQLGIEPVAGHAYLLPFNNSYKVGKDWIKKKEVQFILGYKGVISLYYRHAKSVMLVYGVVHANDEFDYELGTEAFLKHKPAKDDRGQVIGYWIMAELNGGGKPFLYMSHDDCMEHGRKHSKTFNKDDNMFYKKSPWATNPESMCLKTILLKLSKFLPLSIELQQMIGSDETSKNYRQGANMLEIADQTNWDNETEDMNKSIAEAKAK